jgi:HEAT repeat protein
MSLRNAGPAAAKSVRGLAKLLNDPNPAMKIAAATTLGEIGAAAAVTLPALRGLSEDSEEAVATAAKRAIRRLDETARDTGTIPASGVQ